LEGAQRFPISRKATIAPANTIDAMAYENDYMPLANIVRQQTIGSGRK